MSAWAPVEGAAVLRRRRKRGATPRAAREPGSERRWAAGLGGKLLRLVGTLAALAAIGWGGLRTAEWMLSEGAFPLRQVRVEGDLRNLDADDAKRVVEPYLGRNFFMLNMAALHAAFAENPWVEQVAVSRRWPDTLLVSFTERVPYAHWGDGEMLDQKGQRFRPGTIRERHDWPRLHGPNGHEALLMRIYADTRRALAPLGLKVVRVYEDARAAWTVVLDNGIELSLGREQFDTRLQRFIEIYPKVLAAQAERVAAVDLRYVNGFAVRWRPAPADAPPPRPAPADPVAATQRTGDPSATGLRIAG
ncbi:cell division protein FtsQ/DivIB [Plasticicumulans lactativorans]|uniref:cell division protein FtsQ/DivIB n=1 Tax=Plasticicumulans lactativorans TaxID=1133106 RepID=UPI00104E8059|nr:cell division protein FtsQ/DivIB [Plasticicumulans lactativorans]